MIAKDYWDSRYSSGQTSGYGSYGEQLTKKLSWLSNLDIRSISEVGCGDFNFGSNLLLLYPQATYSGCDVSEVILEKNKEKYPQYNFYSSGKDVQRADLLLCVDVLFHVLDDSEYEDLLDTLENTWTKYLAVTAYERDEDLGNHVKIRRFDYKRFGEPLIREIVEEDGDLYFYLFEKPEVKKNDLAQVSCCLNTKEDNYPQEILDHLCKLGFGEILIKTRSESPYCKYELFAKTKYNTIYYQDDDAICPVGDLVEKYDPRLINIVMKPFHFDRYKDKRMTMGLGWGSLFEKSFLKHLKKYTDKYGEDELFKRDTEKILTEIVGQEKQNRIVASIQDLPSAFDSSRLSAEPDHYSNMDIIEKRCKHLRNID